MIEFKYYETENGYLIQTQPSSQFTAGLVNGASPRATFTPEWYIVECPKSETPQLLGPVPHESKLNGWRRIPELDNLPAWIEATETRTLPAEYALLCDCYQAEFEKTPLPRPLIEAKWIKLGTVSWENLEKPEAFSFKLAGETGYGGSAEQQLTLASLFGEYSWSRSHIEVADIQKALAPSFAWHLGPCTLPSHPFYRLVRAYVKENLDGRYAQISSDYDFVFEVKKVLPCKPKNVTYTKIFAKKNAKNRTEVRLEKDRKITVFYITHRKNVHGTEYGAKILEDIKGENLKDLLFNINSYLEDLMARINAPLRICQKCEGSGIEDL